MKKAFTLAEMMVVLIILGILTAIILPNAYKMSPDEEVMRFKKGYSTLGTAIRELTTSEAYFGEDGFLNKKADGSEITDAKYFCNAFADMLSVKNVNCQSTVVSGTDHVCTDWSGYRTTLDNACATGQSKVGTGEITTTDGIIYFNASPGTHFNATIGGVAKGFLTTVDSNGNLRCLKVLCFDIDDLGAGEAPFGFGVRVDGKIFLGARANEWVKKQVSREELD